MGTKMTRDEMMEIMRAHGLYCIPLADKTIGLTDNAGHVYDVVICTDDGRLIIDADTVMSLYDWLGY